MTVAQTIPKEAWDQGVVFVILVAGAIAAWRVSKWAAAEIWVPIRDSWLLTQKEQRENMAKNTETLQRMDTTLSQMSQTSAASQQVSRDLHTGLVGVKESLDTMVAKLKKTHPHLDSTQET